MQNGGIRFTHVIYVVRAEATQLQSDA